MKIKAFLVCCVLSSSIIFGCQQPQSEPKIQEKANPPSPIEGTWKLVYAQVEEEGNVEVRDMSQADFLKIITPTHFAFVSQNKSNNENFYGAAGTYTYDGTTYTEFVQFIPFDEYRNKEFSFTVEIKGDSLIQYGVEKIEDKNIEKHIVEKYVRL